MRAREPNWCCLTFKDYVSEAGKRGVGIYAKRSSVGVGFFLQFRSVDPGQTASAPTPGVKVTLASDLGIVFCPWCGINLENRYLNQLDGLLRPELDLSSSS